MKSFMLRCTIESATLNAGMITKQRFFEFNSSTHRCQISIIEPQTLNVGIVSNQTVKEFNT